MGIGDKFNSFSDKGIELIGKLGDEIYNGVQGTKKWVKEKKDELGIGEHLNGTASDSIKQNSDIRDTALGKSISQRYLGENNHRKVIETGDPD